MSSLVSLFFVLTARALATGTVTYTKLRVLEDVTLEKGITNFDSLRYLIVGTHPGFPLKRSLVRLHPLQVNGCERIRRADLYLYYAYAHKASYMSEAQVPRFSRRIVAHQVLKSWSEKQATSTLRYNGAHWTKPWLELGSDAVATPTSYGLTITPGVTRAGLYPIDVTSAVRNWQNGQANYGLLLRATNEYRLGRDFRFYSKSERNFDRHPYILVTCESSSSGNTGGGFGGILNPVGGGGGGVRPAV